MQTFIISFVCSVLLTIVACVVPTRLKNSGKLLIIAIAFLLTNILFLLESLELGMIKSSAIIVLLFLLITFLLNRKFASSFYHSRTEDNEYISQFSAKDMQKEQNEIFENKKYRSNYFRNLQKDNLIALNKEGHTKKDVLKEESIDLQTSSISPVNELLLEKNEIVTESVKQEKWNGINIQEENVEEDFLNLDIHSKHKGEKEWASEIEFAFNDKKIIQRENSIETLLEESFDYDRKEEDSEKGRMSDAGNSLISTMEEKEIEKKINDAKIWLGEEPAHNLELFLADMEDLNRKIEKEK
ncbi:hypothetical protein [Niallia nealsonii]|uniref:hypothetical protein n=1 Tax=Niallia nealsonii TaxID=115979 RepID=UPI001444EFFB|nr:hypothetical protein [Niallia nealsonii]